MLTDISSLRDESNIQKIKNSCKVLNKFIKKPKIDQVNNSVDFYRENRSPPVQDTISLDLNNLDFMNPKRKEAR